MRVELQKDFMPERQQLDSPVIITLETPEEVEWAYTAFSQVDTRMRGPENGRKDKWYHIVAAKLNEFCVSTGARRFALNRRKDI